MAAGLHDAARGFRGQTGAKWEAAANAFSHAHDVRLGIGGPFMREQLARPAHAALDLVIDQQRAALIAQLAQRRQVVGHRGLGGAARAARGQVVDHQLGLQPGPVLEPVLGQPGQAALEVGAPG